MYLVLFLMFSGIVLGYMVIPRQKDDRVIKWVGRIQSLATIGLLFAMGVWLGGNQDFWDNLKSIGISGMVFSLLSVAGSVLVVHILARIFMKGEAK